LRSDAKILCRKGLYYNYKGILKGNI